jgi:hypothetical protein
MPNLPIKQNEECFQIAGDETHGLSLTHDLTRRAYAHPLIRYTGKYGDFVLEGDLYLVGEGSKREYMLHLICPVCTPKHLVPCTCTEAERPLCPSCEGTGETKPAPHGLSIKSSQKAMSWDPVRGLSVERFGCTWELPAANAGRLEFGLGLCPWRVAIDHGIARDV